MSYGGWDDRGYGGGGFTLPRPTTAVKGLLIANAAVALVQLVWSMSTGDDFARPLGTDLDRFLSNPLMGLVSLVTYQFVHDASGLGHLFVNMVVLYFFGIMVEQQLGTRRFLRLYLGCGVAGGLFWWMQGALTGLADVPVVGASGATYGVLTYAAFMAPMARVILVLFVVPLWVVAALFGSFAVYSWVRSFAFPTGGVAHAAHVGGALAGAGAWLLRARLARLAQALRDRRSRRRFARRQAEEKRLDDILARIKDVGVGGLSASDKRFLERRSRDRKD
ncbi:MAG: rhomboid family intramembrane serine protease [Planctomycetota bacterium]